MKSTCDSGSTNINIESVNTRYHYDTLSKPVRHSASQFNVSRKYTGKGVKIALLDTGVPAHKDIMVDGDQVSFCDQNKAVVDRLGHATLMAGIISSNNSKGLRGVAPHSQILYGKVVSDVKECSFNTLIAGVLWSIIREVDIIVMALGTHYDYPIFHDSIIKAHSAGICIFAAAGNDDKCVDFPADYPEVFSCGCLSRSKEKSVKIKEGVDFYLPNKTLYSSYLDNQYVRVGGSSVATAFFAGLGAVLIERYREEAVAKEKMPPKIYETIIKELS